MKNILLLLVFIGCAQMSVNLKSERIEPFKSFKSVKSLDMETHSIQLNIQDVRGGTHQNQIGTALTGVKYKETPVLLNRDLPTYLNEYLNIEFNKRGVQVDNTVGEVAINLLVTKLTVDELIEKNLPERAKCNIEFQLDSTYLAQNYQAKYWTEIISPGDLGDGTEKIAPTFASCLNVIVNKIVSDPKFINLIKK